MGELRIEFPEGYEEDGVSTKWPELEPLCPLSEPSLAQAALRFGCYVACWIFTVLLRIRNWEHTNSKRKLLLDCSFNLLQIDAELDHHLFPVEPVEPVGGYEL